MFLESLWLVVSLFTPSNIYHDFPLYLGYKNNNMINIYAITNEKKNTN